MPDEIRRLSEALARDPASLAIIPLGEALRRARRVTQARAIAEDARRRHPGNAGAHALVARVAFDLGDLGTAALAWTEAARLAPGHPDAARGLAWLRLQAGEPQEARAILTRALALGEDAGLRAALRRLDDRSAEDSSAREQHDLAPLIAPPPDAAVPALEALAHDAQAFAAAVGIGAWGAAIVEGVRGMTGVATDVSAPPVSGVAQPAGVRFASAAGVPLGRFRRALLAVPEGGA